MAIILLPRDQVRSVLDTCIREGNELITQSETVERSGGYSDWIFLFGRWRERTHAELTAVYDGDDLPREFNAITSTSERSSPRFTVPYTKSTLEMAVWHLGKLVERLPLAVEADTSHQDRPTIPTSEKRGPYSLRPTADLVAAAEDHFLEHKATLRYDLRTKQANPKLEDAVMDRICGFWNAGGGTIIIGVEDRTGRVIGLGPDLKLVQDLDELLNRLSQRLRNDVPSMAPFVRITPDALEGETVLRIEVPSGDRPVFLNDRLMVRITNTTQELKGQSLLDYTRSRFDCA